VIWKVSVLLVLVVALGAAVLLLTSSSKPVSVQTSNASVCRGDVVGYVAPTLFKAVSDAVGQAGMSAGGLLSIGSVEGLRRIQQGAVPDFYASVDIELLREVERLRPRQVYVLGRFSLGLVCRVPIGSPGELNEVSLGIADPNKAPVGYRALAAVWMLKRDGYVDLLPRVEGLGVRYVETGGGINITVPPVLAPAGGIQVGVHIAATWSMVEAGVVDCMFAHRPFILSVFSQLEEVGKTELWHVYRGVRDGKMYHVYLFTGKYSFAEDPPYEIYVVFTQGVARVVRFEAFVASFTERGDCVVDALRGMDLSRYGFG